MHCIRAGVLSASLAAIALIVACGGSPAAPSRPTAPVQATLAPGSYILTLAPDDGTSVPTGGTGIRMWVCMTWGSGNVGSASLAIDLQPEESGLIAHTATDGFALTMRVAAGVVTGDMSGLAIGMDGVTKVTAGLNPGETALLAGTVTDAGTASGRVDGHVAFNTADSGKSCSDTLWSLARR